MVKRAKVSSKKGGRTGKSSADGEVPGGSEGALPRPIGAASHAAGGHPLFSSSFPFLAASCTALLGGGA